MKTYTITLPDELAAIAEKLVADKKFDSFEHLMQYGLMLAENEIQMDEYIDVEKLRADIQAGFDSGDAVDGEAFMEELEASLAGDVQPAGDVKRSA